MEKNGTFGPKVFRQAVVMAPPTPSSENWAVILIHGVGDTEPGRMIDAVSEPLAKASGTLTFDADNEFTKLHEKPGIATTEFPVFMRRGQSDSGRVLVAEVHWADLTRIGVETHLLVAALVRCVYGIRHIALQATLIPGKLGWTLHTTVRSAIFLLQGPVYALYFSRRSCASSTWLSFRTTGTTPTCAEDQLFWP